MLTHDELLARIDKNWDADYDYCDDRRTKALRAIVKLHKLVDWKGLCGSCDYYEYPCPTIQAIEKELE
jgi:hypothetical protein